MKSKPLHPAPRYNPPPLFKFSDRANEQVIYLCGPHGVGKSTLITDLKTHDARRVQEQIAHMEGLTDNISRQIWRNALHCIEHRENLVYAMTQPSRSVVIGDRCNLDDKAYVAACAELGWITDQNRQDILAHSALTYTMSNTPLPINFIVLLPPLDWNIERIEERWREGQETKWCERNFKYLGVVRQQFEHLAQENPGVEVIRDTDRAGRVKKIKDWLLKSDLDDFIVEGRTFIEGVRSNFGS